MFDTIINDTKIKFPALPGYYKFLFLYLEPVSAFFPIIMVQLSGANQFHHELIPTAIEPILSKLDPRTEIAIWQLATSYLLLCLTSSFLFRAVRDGLPHDPATQERIIGATLMALASADVSGTFPLRLPADVRYSPSCWNTMTHGNVTFCVVLFLSRMAWFLGVGRQRYYYGRPTPAASTKAE
ncbi:hypothetical protein BDQ12DRAFT_643714 [Crucibulum laeve]|uniref:DUF7704 domain-containing protein n=1 Tax=Crucibulum laeve TaxID=68775 RepID=A0A5C3MFB6_9AGAR|nr:hypothetical protein BDQ12DRAFT_643714 [Crucibulum laeve]